MNAEITTGNDYQLPGHIKGLADKCNFKHVRVVQAILSGEYSSNTKAYQSVYSDLSDEVAATNVWRMLKNADVSTLHAALRDAQLLQGIISRDEALVILSDMARTNMSDIVEFGSHEVGKDEDGNPIVQSTWHFKDSKNLTPEALRSIQEVSRSAQGLKIKLHDQKAAIKQLSEMLGWNEAAKVGVTGLEFVGDILKPINEVMSLEQATRIYEDNLKRFPC